MFCILLLSELNYKLSKNRYQENMCEIVGSSITGDIMGTFFVFISGVLLIDIEVSITVHMLNERRNGFIT